MSEFSYDDVLAHLRRGDIMRWRGIIEVAANAMRDNGMHNTGLDLLLVVKEFDALLGVERPEDEILDDA